MCGTSVQYEKKPFEGSKTTAKVGNLTFKDPSSSGGNTLYGEILGLKTEGAPRSLLEISYETFPRTNDFLLDSSRSSDEEVEDLVTICQIL